MSELTAAAVAVVLIKLQAVIPDTGDDLGLEHGSLHYSNVFAMTFGFGLDVQCRNLLGSQIKLRSCCQVFLSTLANKSESLFFLSPFALEVAAELSEKAVLHIFIQPYTPDGGWLLMQD